MLDDKEYVNQCILIRDTQFHMKLYTFVSRKPVNARWISVRNQRFVFDGMGITHTRD